MKARGKRPDPWFWVTRLRDGNAEIVLTENWVPDEGTGENGTFDQYILSRGEFGAPFRYHEGLAGRVDAAKGDWLALARALENRALEAAARSKRDALLSQSDYAMAVDYPISDADRAAWAAYRQALRDLPAAPGFPLDAEWPKRPGVVEPGDTVLSVIEAMLGG